MTSRGLKTYLFIGGCIALLYALLYMTVSPRDLSDGSATPDYQPSYMQTTESPKIFVPTSTNAASSQVDELDNLTLHSSDISVIEPLVETEQPILLMYKDVGEPYLHRFGLTKTDFAQLRSKGIDLIGVNFDICAGGDQVRWLLDTANQYSIQVVLPAGAGEAEWGYECDVDVPETQKPIWQDELVTEWVRTWRDHPALYAWDISNEAGGNFPNAHMLQTDIDYSLSLNQLRTAHNTVKDADSSHPTLIRMNGWYFYDFDTNFFRAGNPFGQDITDIVMLNTYSNVEDYYGDFTRTVVSRADSSLKAIDPDIKLIVALGGWEESPLWYKPSLEHVKHDIDETLSAAEPIAIAMYKYGAKGTEWFMPKSYPGLWELFRSGVITH